MESLTWVSLSPTDRSQPRPSHPVVCVHGLHASRFTRWSLLRRSRENYCSFPGSPPARCRGPALGGTCRSHPDRHGSAPFGCLGAWPLKGGRSASRTLAPASRPDSGFWAPQPPQRCCVPFFYTRTAYEARVRFIQPRRHKPQNQIRSKGPFHFQRAPHSPDPAPRPVPVSAAQLASRPAGSSLALPGVPSAFSLDRRTSKIGSILYTFFK